MDDIVLIRQCKQGNRNALDKIIKKYYLPLNKFFYKHVQDPKICEDLTHDVVIKLLENIERYSPLRGAKFSTWLFRIAYNTYVDYVRKNPSHKEMMLDENMDIGFYATEDAVLNKLENDELAVRLKLLPQEMRTLLILRYINGFGYSEISKITGIKESKIKSRLHYSLSKLRGIYSKEGEKMA